MRLLVMMLACLPVTSQGERVRLEEERKQTSSRETRENAQVASNAMSSYASFAKSNHSKPNSRRSALQALAVLLSAFEPTSGFQGLVDGTRSPTNTDTRGRHASIVPRMAVTPPWHHYPSFDVSPFHSPASLPSQTSNADYPEDDFNIDFSRLAQATSLRQKIVVWENLFREERDFTEAMHLRDEIRKLRSKDPALLKSKLRMLSELADRTKRSNEAGKYQDQLRRLKNVLPEYQLAGAWRGRFPTGDVHARIAYNDDSLTASRLDGEVIFNADVSESHQAGDNYEMDYYGTLPDHYKGSGKTRTRLAPGQLYIFDENHIGFLWKAPSSGEGGVRALAEAGREPPRKGVYGYADGGGGEVDGGTAFVHFLRSDDRTAETAPLANPFRTAWTPGISDQLAGLEKMFSMDGGDVPMDGEAPAKPMEGDER